MAADDQALTHSFISASRGQDVLAVWVESQAVDLCIVGLMLLHYTCTHRMAIR